MKTIEDETPETEVKETGEKPKSKNGQLIVIAILIALAIGLAIYMNYKAKQNEDGNG